jgi:hypothetical protein
MGNLSEASAPAKLALFAARLAIAQQSDGWSD